MSIADDLKKEAKTTKTSATATKKKKKRTRRSSQEWSKDDDFIAYFLHRVQASKFLTENYAQKRSIPISAMTKRVKTYGLYRDPRKRSELTEQMLHLMAEHQGKSDMEIETMVIDILKAGREKAEQEAKEAAEETE